MGSIKKRFLDLPLKKALICLVFLMALLVACLSACVISAGTAVRNHLLDTVTVPLASIIPPEKDTEADEIVSSQNMVIAGADQVSVDENGQIVLQTVEYRLQNLSRKNRLIYHGAGAVMIAVPCLLFAAGTILCAWLFYAVKLKKPLALLMQSADRISQDDLDFALDYAPSDEMGQLCKAMEQMRACLQKNNREMWAMMEERRKLNASVAHDLRTPLTVMKGYTEYLSRNVPLGKISEAKLMETLRNLTCAVERMEAYVDQVRDLQALDAVPVRREPVSLPAFLERQKEKYAMLSGTHKLRFELRGRELPDVSLLLDKTLVERMIDNVISNSMRYARKQITMDAVWQDGRLSVCICDDGPGFSQNALKAAATVFYKENSGNDHFGLGLSICDTLCQKQGGTLLLGNGENGGACVVMNIAAAVSEDIHTPVYGGKSCVMDETRAGDQ